MLLCSKTDAHFKDDIPRQHINIISKGNAVTTNVNVDKTGNFLSIIRLFILCNLRKRIKTTPTIG